MATTTADPGSAQPVAAKPRDFRQEVTDRIIGMLEKGVAPWQKPWNPGEASLGMPKNPTTDRNYRGGNALHLMATALQRGYSDPRWMTYKQASDQGWQVRRGEKGTQIEFWEVKPARQGSIPRRQCRSQRATAMGGTVVTHGSSTACTRCSMPNRSTESRNISQSGQLHLKS